MAEETYKIIEEHAEEKKEKSKLEKIREYEEERERAMHEKERAEKEKRKARMEKELQDLEIENKKLLESINSLSYRTIYLSHIYRSLKQIRDAI